jgi:hypothetical protein
MVGLYTAITVLVGAVTLVTAHPGATEEELRVELEARNNYIANLENNNLLHCVKKLDKRDGAGQSEIDTIAKRRMQKVKALRRDLGLNLDGKYTVVFDFSKDGMRKRCR